MLWARLVWWCFVAIITIGAICAGVEQIWTGRVPLVDAVPLAAIMGCAKLVCERIHRILTYERINR
jgi:hypothetical protein